jgi:MHS family proline/betaine transporter-like MFS transporter
VFGGTAQFIVTGMIKLSGNPMSAAWYMAATCLLSFGAVVLIKEQRPQA